MIILTITTVDNIDYDASKVKDESQIIKKEFEWDEDKNSKCKKLRGFQFKDITNAFLDPHRCITPDTRHDYGEERYELLAMHEEILSVVIYTLREEAIRIISARKANEREKIHFFE